MVGLAIAIGIMYFVRFLVKLYVFCVLPACIVLSFYAIFVINGKVQKFNNGKQIRLYITTIPNA